MRRAAAFLLALGSFACARVHEAPPRVLLVTLDTTRADRIGCYGYAPAKTPVLDRLAAEGVEFLDAIAPVPCTLPSHSSMFTGLYPPSTGVRYNVLFKLGDDQTTLAERYKKAGYATAAFPASSTVGKAFGLAQGFDLYDEPSGAAEAAAQGMIRERKANEGVDHALAWLRQHRGDRFFVWLHIWDPHWPYRPPFPFSQEFKKSPYDGEIAFADRELGRLFDFLRSEKLWDDTLVVVAGDHGEGLYDHAESQHAFLCYESTLRVPLLIKAPGGRAGLEVKTPVSLVDLAPTLVEISRLPDEGKPMQGRSLRRALEGRKLDERPLYFEALAGSIVYGWSSLEGIRDGALKLIDSVKPEVYDLASDPGETQNLAAGDPGRTRELAAMLEEEKAKLAPGGSGTKAEEPALDPEARARLASLGYVGGSGGGSAAKRGPWPASLIYLEDQIVALQTALSARDWERADGLSSDILSRDPDNRFVLSARAGALAEMRRYDEALAVADKLLSKYQDSADHFDVRGTILAAMGRKAEAIDAFRQGRRGFPTSEALAFHEALAVYESGDRAGACQRLVPDALSSKIEPKSRILALEARCRAAGGDARGALAALDEATKAGFSFLGSIEKEPEFREVVKLPGFAALKDRKPARPEPPK